MDGATSLGSGAMHADSGARFADNATESAGGVVRL